MCYGIDPASFHCTILELFRLCGIFCFSRFWNCSDSVAFFVFPDYGTVPTVWHFLFFQILELFRQCGIFCFSRIWNGSDSVVFFVFPDFGTVPTVWYYFFSFSKTVN
jgi:hypothetical protein